MTRPPSVLRPALKLMSVRLVLRQIGLALLVFLLYALWLRMPDASVIDVIGSVMLALVVLAVAGAGESALILRLVGVRPSPGRLLRGSALLLTGVLLWFGWSVLLDHMHGDDYLRAGYLNSRFPHQLRNFFSFEHLVLWLGWMWTALDWIGAGVIGLFVVVFTASARPLGAMLRALRCLTYWIAVVVGTTVATLFVGSLIEWTPGHGLRIEMLSLLLRLSLAVVIDATLVCTLLAILAACVGQADAAYSHPQGHRTRASPESQATHSARSAYSHEQRQPDVPARLPAASPHEPADSRSHLRTLSSPAPLYGWTSLHLQVSPPIPRVATAECARRTQPPPGRAPFRAVP